MDLPKIIWNSKQQTSMKITNNRHEIRFLHELIKEDKHIKSQSIMNNDNNYLLINVDNQFKEFDNEDYKEHEIEIINELNKKYKLQSRYEAFEFYNNYVLPLVNENDFQTTNHQQSLEDLEREYQQFRQAAIR